MLEQLGKQRQMFPNSFRFHSYPMAGGLGVPSSNLGAPTNKINDLVGLRKLCSPENRAGECLGNNPAKRRQHGVRPMSPLLKFIQEQRQRRRTLDCDCRGQRRHAHRGNLLAPT